MAVRRFNVMDFGKTGLLEPEHMGYKDSLEIIQDESMKLQKSFVKIGWYLKHIRDNELYREDGYTNIYECATDKLGYAQSTTSRFIKICEKFSKDGNSPELDEKYVGFDKSQMIEMLPMEAEELDRVSPDMTVKQIRDIKTENKQSGKKADQEADDNIPGQTSLEKDFLEYMPKHGTEDLKEDISDIYATSHKEEQPETEKKEMVIDGEYREIEETEEKNDVASQLTKDSTHDESWFVEQYVKIMSNEAAELFEVCRKERNNSDRAKAIQKHIAPYGCHSTSCFEYTFDFHGFASGIDFWIGSEKMHLKYGRFVVELMKLLELEEIVQPELPILKSNEQRKEWLKNYKDWGLWYRDEHIDVNYYMFDFPDDSRLVVAEYPQRHSYYSNQCQDECFYHLLEKNKKGYEKTYDESYRHTPDSMTYLIDFLKNLQKTYR